MHSLEGARTTEELATRPRDAWNTGGRASASRGGVVPIAEKTRRAWCQQLSYRPALASVSLMKTQMYSLDGSEVSTKLARNVDDANTKARATSLKDTNGARAVLRQPSSDGETCSACSDDNVVVGLLCKSSRVLRERACCHDRVSIHTFGERTARRGCRPWHGVGGGNAEQAQGNSGGEGRLHLDAVFTKTKREGKGRTWQTREEQGGGEDRRGRGRGTTANKGHAFKVGQGPRGSRGREVGSGDDELGMDI